MSKNKKVQEEIGKTGHYRSNRPLWSQRVSSVTQHGDAGLEGRKSVFRGPVKAAPKRKQTRRSRHSALYETYMQSDAWKALRETMIDITEGRCERCDASEDDIQLEVHHLTYERLGHEDLDDLEVLCAPCHVIADAERDAETKASAEFNRLDGWATKVYGPNWMWHPGTGEAEDAFEAWLERRS